MIVTRNFEFYTENRKFSNHSLRMRKVADSRGDFAAPEGPGNSAEFAIREKIKAFELGDASEQ